MGKRSMHVGHWAGAGHLPLSIDSCVEGWQVHAPRRLFGIGAEQDKSHSNCLTPGFDYRTANLLSLQSHSQHAIRLCSTTHAVSDQGRFTHLRTTSTVQAA